MNTRRRKIEDTNILSQLSITPSIPSIEILETQTSKSVHNLENDGESLNKAKRVKIESDEVRKQLLSVIKAAIIVVILVYVSRA